jgi:hypothetical protein
MPQKLEATDFLDTTVTKVFDSSALSEILYGPVNGIENYLKKKVDVAVKSLVDNGQWTGVIGAYNGGYVPAMLKPLFNETVVNCDKNNEAWISTIHANCLRWGPEAIPAGGLPMVHYSYTGDMWYLSFDLTKFLGMGVVWDNLLDHIEGKSGQQWLDENTVIHHVPQGFACIMRGRGASRRAHDQLSTGLQISSHKPSARLDADLALQLNSFHQ